MNYIISKIHSKKIFIVFLLLFSNCLVLFSQTINNTRKKTFHNIEVHYVNGKVLTTLVGLPVTNNDNHVFIKDTPQSKKEKVNPDDIEALIITAENGTFILTREKVITNPKKKKVPSYKSWVNPVMICENFMAYEAMYGFTISKQGNFSSIYLDDTGTFCIKRKNEQHPTLVSYIFSRDIITKKMFDKQRLKLLKTYFQNDSKVLSYLNKRDLMTQDQLIYFLDNYCEE